MKAFLIYSGIEEFPAAVESDLLAAMQVLSKRGIPLLSHAEVDWQPPDAVPNEDPASGVMRGMWRRGRRCGSCRRLRC